MKLIDKDALVAEIKSLDALYHTSKDLSGDLFIQGLVCFLTLFEVKEVDFDAEWERYFEHRGEMATVNVKHLAKHFFELGMQVSNKAQKEE